MRIRGLFVGLTLASMVFSQSSPFNGRPLLVPDSAGSYRLLIGGHFHGASTNASGYPAATLLANLAAFNATKANALLSTGDLFLNPDRDSARYAGSFFDVLDLPLFNAPGNHDLEGRAYNQAARMPQVLHMGKDRILLLDTERDDSRIEGDQLDALRMLADSMPRAGRSRLFIVSHRPVWSEEDARFGPLFAGNTRSLTGSNFKADVLPLLERIAKHAEVFWISGSMAGRAPASIFFQPVGQNITYMQCAIRDELRDAVMIADVSETGLTWSAMSLTGQVMEPVAAYNADWWDAHRTLEPAFNWRLLPYLIRKNIGYPSFWYGAAAASVLLIVVGLLLRRRAQH